MNECELANNGGCWSGPPGHNFTACVDTYRGHKCECPAGFSGSGYTCKDIDECDMPTMSSETSNAPFPCDHKCVNTVGDYFCECEPGFRLVGKGACYFVDQCRGKGDNGGCQQQCLPVVDGVQCGCNSGFVLDRDGKTCNAVIPPKAPRQGLSGGQMFGAVCAVFLCLLAAGFGLYRLCIRTLMNREARWFPAPLARHSPPGDGRISPSSLLAAPSLLLSAVALSALALSFSSSTPPRFDPLRCCDAACALPGLCWSPSVPHSADDFLHPFVASAASSLPPLLP